MPTFYLRCKIAFVFTFCFLLFGKLMSAQPDIQFSSFISTGISSPMQLRAAPGDASGRLFIVQKNGLIRIWTGSTVLSTPFLDLSGIVLNSGEQGLLSMAFHPLYASNGFFFVYYNDLSGRVTVARYQVSGNPDVALAAPNPSTPYVSIAKSFTNHNGGTMHFKTEAGINYLYLATGDGGSSNDPQNNSQNQGSRLGKMLRFDADQASPVIETWAWGLRNPYRWSFDLATGDLWIGDVGQGQREEIDFRAAGAGGANYGWPCVEGTLNNGAAPAGGDCDSVRAVDVAPVFEYQNPSQGNSVIGGYVYRGTEFPSLQGYYLATDYASGNLWILYPDGLGGFTEVTRAGFPTGISSFSETPDGTLYATSLNENKIFKIVVPFVTPVHLLGFSGKAFNGYNELSWSTEAEDGIEKYAVEYSADGRSFTSAGERAAGNSGSVGHYVFQHSVNGGALYYRLRIFDRTGANRYSPVIRLGSGVHSAWKVYPTIITNQSVNIVSGWPVDKLTVVALDGRIVLSKEMNGTEGFFNLPLTGLARGMYLIRCNGDGNQQRTDRILIQ